MSVNDAEEVNRARLFNRIQKVAAKRAPRTKSASPTQKTEPTTGPTSSPRKDRSETLLQPNKSEPKVTAETAGRLAVISPASGENLEGADGLGDAQPVDYEFLHKERYKYDCELVPMLVATFVGFSNLVIFPQRMYLHGGILYLIPYSICLFTYGLQVGFIETYIGQFTRVPPLIGYQRIAPILKTFAWTDVVCTTFTVLRSNLHMILALKALFHVNRIEGFAWCQQDTTGAEIDDIECLSLHDSMVCSNLSLTQLYLNKDCVASKETDLKLAVEKTRVTLPMEEFCYTIVTKISDSIDEWGGFDALFFLATTLVLIAIGGALLLPVRHYARIMGAIQVVSMVLLIVLVFHMYADVPAVLKPTLPLVNGVLTPRPEKLLDIVTWAKALEHCILSVSLGQSQISAMSIYNNRHTYTVKYVLAAMLIDLCYGLLGGLIGGAVNALILASTFGIIDFYDITRTVPQGSIEYLFVTVLQVLTYYSDTRYIVVYLLAVILVMLPNIMAGMLYLFQFIIAFCKFEFKWKCSILSVGVAVIMAACHSFENYIFVYEWIFTSRSWLLALALALKQVIFIGCYGSAQVRFDLFFMNSLPKTKCERLWTWVNSYVKKLYFSFTPFPTTFYVCWIMLSINWSSEVTPFPFLRSHPFIASFVNPPMIFTFIAFAYVLIENLRHRGAGELMKVQPGLPSHDRIRESLESFEQKDQPFLEPSPGGDQLMPVSSKPSLQGQGHVIGKTPTYPKDRKSTSGSEDDLHNTILPLLHPNYFSSRQVGPSERERRQPKSGDKRPTRPEQKRESVVNLRTQMESARESRKDQEHQESRKEKEREDRSAESTQESQYQLRSKERTGGSREDILGKEHGKVLLVSNVDQRKASRLDVSKVDPAKKASMPNLKSLARGPSNQRITSREQLKILASEHELKAAVKKRSKVTASMQQDIAKSPPANQSKMRSARELDSPNGEPQPRYRKSNGDSKIKSARALGSGRQFKSPARDVTQMDDPKTAPAAPAPVNPKNEDSQKLPSKEKTED